MSDFKSVANETATKLTLMVQEIEQAQASLDSLEQLVDATTTQIDTQWTELNSRAETLLNQLSAIRDQINTEATEVGQSLSQLKEKIASAQSEVEQEFNETKTGLDQLGSSLETIVPEQEETWQSTEEALTMLQEKTEEVETAIETAFSETGSWVQGELVTAMQTQTTGVVEQTDTLNTYITSECLAQLTEKSNEFSQRLIEVSDQLSQHLLETSSNTENSVTASLEGASSQHNSTIGSLVSMGQDASRALEDVGGTIDKTSSNALEALGLISTATDTTNVGFNTAVRVFNKAEELLQKLGVA